jgi:crotonobetainyl-CoA:carnitine CoA-transferase CaiB-like acyl-CoA transferase
MRTKDGFLMVGATGDAIWARCAKALGRAEWCEDPRFSTNQARMANRDALEDVMNAVLTTKSTSDWVEVHEAAGVPCGPVYDYAQMFADPQVRYRGLVQYAIDPDLGEVSHIRTRSRSARVCGCAPSPQLGQHNAEIFGRIGVSEVAMMELRARGVL